MYSMFAVFVHICSRIFGVGGRGGVSTFHTCHAVDAWHCVVFGGVVVRYMGGVFVYVVRAEVAPYCVAVYTQECTVCGCTACVVCGCVICVVFVYVVLYIFYIHMSHILYTVGFFRVDTVHCVYIVCTVYIVYT